METRRRLLFELGEYRLIVIDILLRPVVLHFVFADRDIHFISLAETSVKSDLPISDIIHILAQVVRRNTTVACRSPQVRAIVAP